jgi:hypothetical protein
MSVFVCYNCHADYCVDPKLSIRFTSNDIDEFPKWDKWITLSKEEQANVINKRNKQICNSLHHFCSLECAIEYLQKKGENEL